MICSGSLAFIRCLGFLGNYLVISGLGTYTHTHVDLVDNHISEQGWLFPKVLSNALVSLAKLCR